MVPGSRPSSSHGWNKKTVSQKMASSHSLKETQFGKSEQTNLCECPGEPKQAEQAEDPEQEQAGVLGGANKLDWDIPEADQPE